MKSILITGGAGKIGYNLVTKLIDTNYNVTVLDLESKRSTEKLQPYKNSVKIVYGDIEDKNLVRDLVRRNDIVIDYAGIMPPFANMNSEIANSINFGGTKNIVDSINEINPDCVYIYMSFISVYGESDYAKRELEIKTESNHPDDYYSVSLIRSEEYIRSNLKKYTILRMPIVITSKNYFLKSMRLNTKMDFITRDDLNDIVLGIMNSKKILGRTYNVSGFRASTNDVIEKIYQSSGELSMAKRKLYYGLFEDGDKISEIAKVKCMGLRDAFEDMERETSSLKRRFFKIVNYPKYLIFKRKIRK